MPDPNDTPTAEEMRAYVARFELVNRVVARERRERMLDQSALERDWLRAVALTRRLVREGVAEAPSDWPLHEAWSELQRRMLERAGDAPPADERRPASEHAD